MSEKGLNSILISSPTSPGGDDGEKGEEKEGRKGKEKTNKARAVRFPLSVVSKEVPFSKRTSITSEQFLKK